MSMFGLCVLTQALVTPVVQMCSMRVSLYVCHIWCPLMLVYCADSAAAVSAISSDKHGSNHGETFQADATDYVNLKRPSYYRQDHEV